MTRAQRIARSFRWACDGVAVILGIVAFVDLVGGDGSQGWLFVALGAVAFAIGQAIRKIVKGSDGWSARRAKAKGRK